jgi:hypothetical protein
MLNGVVDVGGSDANLLSLSDFKATSDNPPLACSVAATQSRFVSELKASTRRRYDV